MIMTVRLLEWWWWSLLCKDASSLSSQKSLKWIFEGSNVIGCLMIPDTRERNSTIKMINPQRTYGVLSLRKMRAWRCDTTENIPVEWMSSIPQTESQNTSQLPTDHLWTMPNLRPNKIHRSELREQRKLHCLNTRNSSSMTFNMKQKISFGEGGYFERCGMTRPTSLRNGVFWAQSSATIGFTDIPAAFVVDCSKSDIFGETCSVFVFHLLLLPLWHGHSPLLVEVDRSGDFSPRIE